MTFTTAADELVSLSAEDANTAQFRLQPLPLNGQRVGVGGYQDANRAVGFLDVTGLHVGQICLIRH